MPCTRFKQHTSQYIGVIIDWRRRMQKCIPWNRCKFSVQTVKITTRKVPNKTAVISINRYTCRQSEWACNNAMITIAQWRQDINRLCIVGCVCKHQIKYGIRSAVIVYMGRRVDQLSETKWIAEVPQTILEFPVSVVSVPIITAIIEVANNYDIIDICPM